jgi:hypothetical protein
LVCVERVSALFFAAQPWLRLSSRFKPGSRIDEDGGTKE